MYYFCGKVIWGHVVCPLQSVSRRVHYGRFHCKNFGCQAMANKINNNNIAIKQDSIPCTTARGRVNHGIISCLSLSQFNITKCNINSYWTYMLPYYAFINYIRAPLSYSNLYIMFRACSNQDNYKPARNIMYKF